MTSSMRIGWLTLPGTGSTPSSGQKNRQPTTSRCRCSPSWSSRLSSVAWYSPEKYSANGLPTNSSQPNAGKLSSATGLLCSTASRPPRGPLGSVRSASVTGAPSARNTGATIASSMCWTMCAENRSLS